MNNKDVINLIEEWIHKPAGSRPILEKAIAEQYRKARESLWLGLQEDELLAWLRETMTDTTVDGENESEIESRIAELLTEQYGRTETGTQDLELAALRATPEHNGTINMPDDAEIAKRVKSILERLD